MLSPQSSASSTIVISEEELHQVPDNPRNTKDFAKFLKQFSYLGSLHSKLNFMKTCLSNSLVPKGFFLKWTEQTGFASQNLKTSVSTCLRKTSLELVKLVFEESYQKFYSTLSYLLSKFQEVPLVVWTKGMKNYQFFYKTYSERHQQKLKKLCSEVSLQPFLPTLNLVPVVNFNPMCFRLKS